MKIKRIEWCDNCDGYDLGYCMSEGKFLSDEEKINKIIPPWCPLEDIKNLGV